MVVFNIFGSLFIGYAALWALKHDKKYFKPWLILAIGQSFFAFAYIIYSILNNFFTTQSYPSMADVFFFASYPLFTTGLLLMFRPIKMSHKTLIDVLIAMISATLILWSLVIRPALEINADLSSALFSILYIFFDILMLMVILSLLFNITKKTLLNPLAFFSLSVFSQIIGDILFAYSGFSGSWIYDWTSSIFYASTGIFMALAGISYYKRIGLNLNDFIYYYRGLKKRKNWISYFPLLLVIVVYGLLIYIESPDDWLIWGVGAIIVLVVFRQFISINEIKKAQKEINNDKNLILRREEQLKFVTSNIMGVIAETDENGVLKFLTESSSRILGYKPQELIGKKLQDYIHPDDKKKFQEVINNSIEKKGINKVKYRFKNKNGNYLWFESIEKSVFMKDSFYRHISSMRDINEKVLAKEALIKTEDKYRIIFENTGALTIILDKNMNILLANNEFEKFSGYRKDEIESKLNLKDFIDDTDKKSINDCIMIKNQSKERMECLEIKNQEISLLDRQGNKKYFVFTSEVIVHSKSILMSLIDITDRKDKEEIIEASLVEKDMMLKEIHHRVKNNLQIISSLLNLQSGNVSDDKDLELFIESRDRVRSMAMIHEKLYQSENLSKINFKDYLMNLAQQLLMSYDLSGKVNLNFDCDDVFMGIETAVPCGLLVNELITNSMKHAFPNELSGNISIVLKEYDDYEIIISDDGIGFPKDINIDESNSLGLQIVSNLINQIDGTIEINNSHGTQFKIKFQELNYKKRF
ncbi:MAG: PAS domain S-box protein [Methanobacteriaceae archaeon]|nr:PAS domain S-box protein [Methanobacteriaceae archaeon]MDP2835839.1 PAS domain S-box protein [Methanobacteriaceae archaeon]MDP3034642.1 PAS domain S-box protein [Methanobacteriaceae archaeon]MDP3622332.1 PAS domain S-box protein [Methanobacteriaceae archaeon]